MSGPEFGRFRADFQAFQTRLDTRLSEGFDGMNARLDDLNGRTRKNAEATAVLDERIASIKQAGCGQLAAHRAALETLPVAEARTWRDWHPAAKAGAGVGGMAALAAMIELVQRILQHFGI